MSDLPELIEWTPGIYQLETSDPVLGGPDGIDNLQGKQLANRTKWLRNLLEEIIDGSTATGKAAKLETPRALAFKGAATGTGNFDGSANTEITLTLADSGVAAGTWPKVTVNKKGVVTGGASLTVADLPEVNTPPQFDSDKSFATTEFVKRTGIEYSSFTSFSNTANLTKTHVGGLHSFSSASLISATLPPTADVAQAATITIVCAGAGGLTVQAATNDVVFTSNGVAGSVSMALGDTAEFIRLEAQWRLIGGTIATRYSAMFSGAVGSSGWKRHPCGTVEQWINVAMPTTQGGATPFNWPVAFENGVDSVAFATNYTTSTAGYLALSVTGRTKTGAQLLNNGMSGTLGAVLATTIIAIGR